MVQSAIFRIFFIAFALCFFSFTNAADYEVSPDIRSLSLGNVYSLSKEFINPAYLSFHERPLAGISIFNKFGIKELNTYNLYGIIPNKFIDTGIKISKFGYSEYSVLTMTMGLSKKIHNRISLGASLYYVSELIYSDDNQNKFNADIGVFLIISEKARLAFLTKNIASSYTFDKPVLYGGLSYELFESCEMIAEISSDCNQYFNLTTGAEYELVDHFFIRAGVQTKPKKPSFGFGYSFNSFTIDYSFSNHQQLGNSNSIGIAYCF